MVQSTVQMDGSTLSPGHDDTSSDDVDEPVAARVRELLTQTGLSKRELANKLGLSESYISQVARGLKRPGTEFLFALRLRLGVSVDWLITGVGSLYSLYGSERIRPELLRSIVMQIATVRAAIVDNDTDAKKLLTLIQQDREDAIAGDDRFRELLDRIAPESPDMGLAMELYDSREWAVNPTVFRKALIAAAIRHFEGLPSKDRLSALWAVPRSEDFAPTRIAS